MSTQTPTHNHVGGDIMDRGVIFFVLLVGIILLILLVIVSSSDNTSGSTVLQLVQLYFPKEPVFLTSTEWMATIHSIRILW
jgi:hypothetical protein